MTYAWLNKISFVAACIAVPIVWGWLVNWAFSRWDRRVAEQPHDDPFIDYHI